jgi:ribosome-binding factor A
VRNLVKNSFEKIDIIESTNKAVSKLNSIKGVFRNEIAKSIQSKKTPKLNFEVDTLPEHIEQIEKTLKEVSDKNTTTNILNTANYKKEIH